MLNLLSNAEKFTEEGRIDLNIDVVEENKDSCHIFFSVTDTGIGLSSEEQKFIFQKFKQADPSIRRMYGGTGLGLTISKNLVGLLGGELIVASEKGKGSKFSFSLELKKGSLRKSVKKKSGKISDLLTEAKKKHILIVEDNLMNQKYISSLLSKWDVNYTICNNGLEAIEAADREKYDLIFMDLSMPVMDGYTACRKIQEGMGLNAETIIIALTASTFLSKKQLALEAGMKDFISKPFTPDQLSFYLKKYLSNKSYDIAHATFVFDNALDVSALKELYGDDIEYASEMFDMFLSVIVDEMKIIENICESDNLIAVHKQAHKMKPTFKMVGLTELFSLMEELEKSTDIQQVIKGITQLRSKLSEKLPILKIESDRMKSELLKINQ